MVPTQPPETPPIITVTQTSLPPPDKTSTEISAYGKPNEKLFLNLGSSWCFFRIFLLPCKQALIVFTSIKRILCTIQVQEIHFARNSVIFCFNSYFFTHKKRLRSKYPPRILTQNSYSKSKSRIYLRS